MPVQLDTPSATDLFPIAGVRIGVAEAGIRKANRKDLSVFLLDEGSAVGAVFTRNRYAAAPVQVCREHLSSGQGIRALIINTGSKQGITTPPGDRWAAAHRPNISPHVTRMGVDVDGVKYPVVVVMSHITLVVVTNLVVVINSTYHMVRRG